MTHQLSKYPKMLILHLKRFSIIGNSYIKRQDLITLANELEFGNALYQLTGIVSHLGSNQKNGHYVYDRKHRDNWTCYNDAIVTPNLTDRSIARKDCAYILMYLKV
jgi:ubiquitin C-terminal hydrolase